MAADRADSPSFHEPRMTRIYDHIKRPRIAQI
jgi:hypothetical protein